MTHGTTPACGPACDNLLLKKNGTQRHVFALELSVDNDRQRAYFDAGYRGKNWRQRSAENLSKQDVWASYAHHCQHHDLEVVDRATQLRDDLWAAGQFNIFDLFVAQAPEDESYIQLEHLIKYGVEDREKEGGYRDPSPKEKQRAIDKAASFRSKRPEEIPVDIQMLVDEVHYDASRGIYRYKINRHASRELFAKITGQISQTLNINHARIMVGESIDRSEAALHQLVAILLPAATPASQSFVQGVAARALTEAPGEEAKARWSYLVESATGAPGEVEECFAWMVSAPTSPVVELPSRSLS